MKRLLAVCVISLVAVFGCNKKEEAKETPVVETPAAEVAPAVEAAPAAEVAPATEAAPAEAAPATEAAPAAEVK